MNGSQHIFSATFRLCFILNFKTDFKILKKSSVENGVKHQVNKIISKTG